MEWRTVKGFEGVYELRSDGLLYSYPREGTKGGYSYGTDNGKGYLKAALSLNGKTKTKKMHILVYETFVGEVPKGYDVHHINHNKSDNRVENLQLLTKSEHKKLHSNSKITKERRSKNHKGHSFTKEQKEKQRKNSPLKKAVVMLNSDGEILNMFQSTYEAAEQTSLSRDNICRCCLGQRKTCGSFYWEYLLG